LRGRTTFSVGVKLFDLLRLFYQDQKEGESKLELKWEEHGKNSARSLIRGGVPAKSSNTAAMSGREGFGAKSGRFVREKKGE